MYKTYTFINQIDKTNLIIHYRMYIQYWFLCVTHSLLFVHFKSKEIRTLTGCPTIFCRPLIEVKTLSVTIKTL